MNSQLDMIEKRLRRLERTNRHLKLALLVAIICVSALGVMGAQQTANRTIEANEFVLRGPNGHIRATLSADREIQLLSEVGAE